MKIIIAVTDEYEDDTSEFGQSEAVANDSQNEVVESTSILSLPPELLVHLFRGIHIKELLILRLTHQTLRAVIDSNSCIWTTCTFRDQFPDLHSIGYFDRAAEHDNIDAIIKLGLAYHPRLDEQWFCHYRESGIRMNDEKAAKMLCKAEEFLNAPFAWMFLFLCKWRVFKNMSLYASENASPSVQLSLSKTLQSRAESDHRCGFEDRAVRHERITYHLAKAAAHGSVMARYLLWEQKYNYSCDVHVIHRTELQSIQELRNIAVLGDMSAHLTLCHLYAAGKYGDCDRQQAVSYVRNFVQSSSVLDVRAVYSGELTSSIRMM